MLVQGAGILFFLFIVFFALYCTGSGGQTIKSITASLNPLKLFK